MPNVMGRKFPYTPKGEQDAEDYGKSVAVVEQTMPGAAEGVKRRAVERLMEELKARRNRSLLGRSLDAVREGPQGEARRHRQQCVRGGRRGWVPDHLRVPAGTLEPAWHI